MKNISVLLRLIIGCVFIVSGFEKLISPYQNFLYVIQGYDVIPDGLDTLIAQVFPWIELFAGIFVLLGLWTEHALRVVLLMVTGFLLIVGQAMIRNLPIDECGCFGELVSLPLWGVFLFDCTLWIVSAALLIKGSAAFSLDEYFSRTE